MKIVGIIGIFYVRHSSYIRRRKKMPKYFVSENIKNHAVKKITEKTKIKALCYELTFFTLKKNLPSHLRKMDKNKCPFFLSDLSYFLD